MKKYIKPTIELENLQMNSILLDSDPINYNNSNGTFDDAKKDSFADLFGNFFN